MWPSRQARSSVLLGHVAECAVHRGGIVERVLLLSGTLLSGFVVLSVVFFTVICCSSCMSCSFWASCGAGGVDGGWSCGAGIDAEVIWFDEGWFDEAKYCCMTECMILIKSWTCCFEKLGTDGSALDILMTDDRMVYWKNRSDDDSWLNELSSWLIAKRKRKGADCHRHTGPLVGWRYIWLDKVYLVGVAINCQRSKWDDLILFYDVMDYCWIVTGKWPGMCGEAPRLALWPRLLLVMIDIRNRDRIY